MKDIALVYMVAGISSRFKGNIKPLTKVTPQDTLIEYSLNQAIPAGFNKIVFIVGNRTEQPFKEKFGTNYQGVPIHYALQRYDESERDRPWGTTDALCSIIPIINEPFVVCNGDNIYGPQAFKTLYDHLQQSDEHATLGYRLGNALSDSGPVNKGIFKVENNYVQNLKEVIDITRYNLVQLKLNLEDLCSATMFGLHPETLTHLKEILDRFKQENTGHRTAEALLPTHIADLIKQGKVKMRVYRATEPLLGITRPGDEESLRKTLEQNPYF